ncbi:vitamin D3 hydroxylase-associated protein isoform X2 [Bombina bombina]|uniref:vitamin D3 hydroxylase-associated protein isoform X2 n=1 Tax=Bombina bombina TaxID=8345 RepID=UPI00235ABD83|nr:vitamin D3 hydroxylase-associated protein isoform X2 [Bombina bombina]
MSLTLVLDRHLVLPAVGCTVSLLLLLRWLRNRRLHRLMKEVRDRREQALSNMEVAVRRLSSENPVADPGALLSLSLSELSNKLNDGSLSPEMVLHVYMKRALDTTRELNCLTDYLCECEAQLKEVNKQKMKGLLYGVPISLKDNFNYKGHESTLGLIKNLNRPASEDCVIVQVLKKQGAIPFVKTNIPQSMLNYDCSNLIFGRTLNPLNHKKTPGGSSGGEGALISAGGSILGFGSDIGGSIRFPCSFCGLCGLKLSGNRISKIGVMSSSPGQKSVMAMTGPLARDVESLALCMRALLCEEMFRLDPTVPPIPFNEEVYSSSKPLCIGYYYTDGFTMATPSMQRAVMETKELLEKAGHKLVPFAPPSIEKAIIELAMKGILADSASTFLDNFKHDLVDPNLKSQINMYLLPNWLKSLLSMIVKPVYPRVAKLVKNLTGVRCCILHNPVQFSGLSCRGIASYHCHKGGRGSPEIVQRSL